MSLYIIRGCYQPNKAETNRLLAYLRVIDSMDVQATVVFFKPDSEHSELTESFRNIKIKNCWKACYSKNGLVNRLMANIYLHKFIWNLKSGDRVFLLGCDYDLKYFVRKKNIKVFFECTEKPDLFNFRGLYSDWQIKMFLKASLKLDGISVISTALENYFLNLGLPKNKIHIVNMTVDPLRFIGLQKEPVEKYIAYCGTATNNKDGVDQLIRAFSIFLKSHSDYKLYIIGSTPFKNEEFTNKHLVESLGISDKILFTGVKPASEIPQLLKNASILALDRPDNPQAEYGFPTKLGEYLLTANPVVVTAVGDIPLFLKDRESAVLVKPDSPDYFAAGLAFLADNPTEAAKIGAAGFHVAMKSFNANIETAKLIKMIMD